MLALRSYSSYLKLFRFVSCFFDFLIIHHTGLKKYETASGQRAEKNLGTVTRRTTFWWTFETFAINSATTCVSP